MEDELTSSSTGGPVGATRFVHQRGRVPAPAPGPGHLRAGACCAPHGSRLVTTHRRTYVLDTSVLPAGFRNDSNDSRIMVVALNLRGEGRDVCLVTKDVPLRVKAAAVGLATEEYRGLGVVDAGWTGMAELSLEEPEIRELYEHGSVHLP